MDETRAKRLKNSQILWSWLLAADDGVKPQTIESLSNTLRLQVPIVVAINKCDLPEAIHKSQKSTFRI